MDDLAPLFDPNLGATADRSPASYGAILPHEQRASDAQTYADVFAKADGVQSSGGFGGPYAKALATPPVTQDLASIAMVANIAGNGVLDWPGINPLNLQRLARQHQLPMVIIQQRIADVLRYTTVSTQPWKPGWKIELRVGSKEPTEADQRDMREAELLILSCNDETGLNTLRRDEAGLFGHQSFIQAIVRDRCTYGAFAVWRQMTPDGRVKAYKPYPTANIKLVKPGGMKDDPSIFAVGVDNAGNVLNRFTRRDLVWRPSNRRVDSDIGDYPFSEIEMALTVIQAFSNAVQMNADVFTRNSIPNGILKLKGYWTQRQVDVITKVYQNLKRGSSKEFSVPAMAIPKDGDIEILDLMNLKGNDVYFREHMNMMAGLFCGVYNFPVNRLGYHASGGPRDSSPDPATSPAAVIDEDDVGLPVLLNDIEAFYNESIIWPNFPHLQMVYQGKNPKEDARAYEARKNAATLGEMRAQSDWRPLPTLGGSPEHKELLELMELTPQDPAQSPVWQNIVSIYLAARFGTEGGADGDSGAGEGGKQGAGARMQPSKDPASSRGKGKEAGVRRNSSAEGKSGAQAAAKAGQTLYVHRPVINGDEIVAWAKSQGFVTTLLPGDLHVTVAFSRDDLNWNQFEPDTDPVLVTGSRRALAQFGDATVLRIKSADLSVRWREFRDGGASWDFDGYQPHITLSYNAGYLPLEQIEAFTGVIELGAEVFATVVEGAGDGVPEA